MRCQFDVVIEHDEAGIFVASVRQLAGSHTEANPLDRLMDRIREAFALCLDVEDTDVERLEFPGVRRITVAA